jgi:hypothetical protein
MCGEVDNKIANYILAPLGVVAIALSRRGVIMDTGRHGAMGMILIGLAALSLPSRPSPAPSELDRRAALLVESGIDISNTSAVLQGIIGTPSDVRGRVATNSLTPEVTAQLKELHQQLGEQLENLEKAQRVEEKR